MQAQTLSGFPLSSEQKRLWELQQQPSDLISSYTASSYTAQCALRISSALQVEILQTAIQQIVDRHTMLRTQFQRLPGMKTPVMIISNSGAASWRVLPSPALNPEQEQAWIESYLQQDGDDPFDLEHGPLLRVSLLQLADQTHLLVLSLPALCADAWSLQTLAQSIHQSYKALTSQTTPHSTHDEVVQFVQFSTWQQQLLAEPEAKAAKTYWQHQKLEYGGEFTLPYRQESPNTEECDRFNLRVTPIPDIAVPLEVLAQSHQTSVATVCLAAWQTLLWRLTGTLELGVDTYFSRRSEPELQTSIGLFGTYLPIKIPLSSDLRFTELIAQVDQTLSTTEAWQDYFQRDWLELESQQHLSIGFEFQQWAPLSSQIDVSFSLHHLQVWTEPFQLKLYCQQHSHQLSATIYADPQIYSETAVQKIAEQFQVLLTQAVLHPAQTLSELKILTPLEEHQLLVTFNETQRDRVPVSGFQEWFAEQVEQTPDYPAVRDADRHLTYRELNARANQLAHYLHRFGIGPEVVVGLCLERSHQQIIALLGILKAGGAYLPLDPSLPIERLAWMLEDSGAALLLTESSIAESLSALPLTKILVDHSSDSLVQEAVTNPNRKTHPKNLAYVVYTSGSTGKPKGVAIEHQQLLNYVSGILEQLEPEPGLSFATLASLATDLGNTAIFPALCTGGCLHLLSRECTANAAALAQAMQAHPIDCLKIVPSHLMALLQTAAQPEQILPRRLLILGGEELHGSVITQLHAIAPYCRLINHYGPTETTIGVLTHAIPAAADRSRANLVPLGRPLANTEAYVLDPHLNPVPVGIAGELYIGGEGLARGYRHQSAQTAKQFIPHPFSQKPGARLYKTGDWVRYSSDGVIEFLGRTDHQVKIRGFRVELAEIEAVLGQHPQVQQAVIILWLDAVGQQRLVAYWVAHSTLAVSNHELRQFLRKRLPEYMVPAVFGQLQSLPRLPNGKVDRRALPAPEELPSELAIAPIPPQTETEQTIAQIWQVALQRETVGIHDNFFDLGGHSLLLVQVHSKLQQAFTPEITVSDLFQYPTISTLARHLSTTQPEAAAPQRIQARAGIRQRSLEQQRQRRQSRSAQPN
jgi:amino acid adenylation domain-containing protein